MANQQPQCLLLKADESCQIARFAKILLEYTNTDDKSLPQLYRILCKPIIRYRGIFYDAARWMSEISEDASKKCIDTIDSLTMVLCVWFDNKPSDPELWKLIENDVQRLAGLMTIYNDHLRSRAIDACKAVNKTLPEDL